jgi:hypothetical protein
MDTNQILSNFELFEHEIEALKQQHTGLNQEVVYKLTSYFNNATDTLDGTASDFNFRLQTAVTNTKDDIEVKIESLKSRLDLIRESMFMDLDRQEEELRKYFNLTLKLILNH